MRPEDIENIYEPWRSLHHILGEQAHFERFLASWLAIHAGAASEGQREYVRQEATAQAYLSTYVYGQSEITTPRHPIFIADDTEESDGMA